MENTNTQESFTNLNQQNLIQETLDCLMKTFKEKNNTERQKAEIKLKELEGNILTHVRSILLGLSSSNINNDLKMSIVLYLKNSIRSRIESRNFSDEQVRDIVNIFIEVMLTGGLNDQLMQNLNLTFTSILNSLYITHSPEFVVNISDFLFNYVNTDANAQTNIAKDKPVIFLLQTIISSSCTNIENIADVLSKHINLTELVIKNLSFHLRTLTLKENSLAYISIIDIIRLILDYLFLSLIKLKKLEIISEFITVIVNKFLNFAIDAISCSNSNDVNFILFTEDKQIDNSLNSMKAKAFQLISYMIQNDASIVTNYLIVERLSSLVSISISSLNFILNEKSEYISNMDKHNSNYPDNNYDALMFQCMLFLSRFLIKEPIITQFSIYVKNFTLTIILPLIQTTMYERCQMIIDGEEHHNNLIDYTMRHKGKGFKTSACFLLTKLCEKYDGLSNFIINFCFQLIDFCMLGSNTDSLNNYSYLDMKKGVNDITGENFSVGIQKILTTLSAEFQIDTALTTILILNNYVNKTPRYLATLRLLLETHSDKIFTINSDIIKDKLCIVLGTFLDELYRTDEIEGFYLHLARIFDFLITQLLNFNKNQGLAYSASYSLCQLVYYKDFADVTNNIIRKYMPNLIECIKEIEVVLFFDVLVDILLYIDLEDFILQTSKELTNRILKEIKSCRNVSKGKELNVYVSKCFHLLRTILEKNKMFMKEENEIDNDDENHFNVQVIIETNALEINEFENIIEPLVNYLKNVNKIDFDDEIIYLMINVIQNAKKITPLCKKILPNLPQYVFKNQGVTEEIFELLNYFIIYDDKNFLIDDNLSTMENLIKTGLEESDENDNSSFFTAILMQTWIHTAGKNIPENVIIELIVNVIKSTEEIYNTYSDCIDQLESTSDVYIFSTFLSTIYSAIESFPFLILKKLYDLKIFEDFIKWTELMTGFSFYSTYFSKVIIIGISSILSDANILNNLGTQYTEKFLFLSFSLLVKQKNAESSKLKTALRKELECNFIESDEEEENDEEEEYHQAMRNIKSKIPRKNKMNNFTNNISKEDKQIHKLISKLKSKVIEIDEYNTFYKMIQNFNTLNSQCLLDFINLLNEPQKILWNELIHTRRIPVDCSGVQMNIPRRTVKIKKNM